MNRVYYKFIVTSKHQGCLIVIAKEIDVIHEKK